MMLLKDGQDVALYSAVLDTQCLPARRWLRAEAENKLDRLS